MLRALDFGEKENDRYREEGRERERGGRCK
jgi:hypothetical protein